MKTKPNFKLLIQEDRLYQIPNPLIGLTGGIATGKSTAAKYIREMGFTVLDADKLVKEIYAKKESLEFVKLLAPDCIFDDQINFPELRKKVFATPELKTKIEDYIYSRLPDMFLETLKTVDPTMPIFYDVPLLFEKKLNLKSDLSLVVYSPKATQVQRLIERDKIEEDLAKKIISNQMDIEEKKKLADHAIENTQGLNELKTNVENCLSNLFI